MKSKLKTKKAKTRSKIKKPTKIIDRTEIELDLNFKCGRCKYPLPKNNKINLCNTCIFERFVMAATKLNEYV